MKTPFNILRSTRFKLSSWPLSSTRIARKKILSRTFEGEATIILEKPRKKFEIYTLQQSCEYSDGNFATFRRARHIKKVKTPLYIKVKSCPHFLRVSNTIIKFKKSMFASLWKKFTKVRDRRQIFFAAAACNFTRKFARLKLWSNSSFTCSTFFILIYF